MNENTMLSLLLTLVAFQDYPPEVPVQPIPWGFVGPFVRTEKGILGYGDSRVLYTVDEGKHWQAWKMFPESEIKPVNDSALVRTKSGALVAGFLNAGEIKFQWDPIRNMPTDDTKSDLYTSVSTDDGHTWSDPKSIQDTYCGASRSMVETTDGSILLAGQSMYPAKPRHNTVIYRSEDGSIWNPAAVFDIGGHGNHDGIFEGSLVALKDNGVLCMMRTNTDFLYQATSSDGGRTWSEATATSIPSSSSPPTLTKLQSGRILLMYNPLYPVGKTTVARSGYPASEHAASWYRRELYARYSDDEGKTWSSPKQLVNSPNKDIGYSTAFEVEPGRIWVTTAVGHANFEFKEADLVKSN